MTQYAGFTEEVEQGEFDKALLEGLGESVVVEVFNPLKVPFRAKFARSLPQAPQLSEQEKKISQQIGASLSKDQGQGQSHATSYIILQPGETKKLPGNVAQVVVRQMVTYIIQQRGNRGLVSDPKLRRDVEKELVINYRSMIQTQTLTPEEKFQAQLDELNNPGGVDTAAVEEEVAFPGIGNTNEQVGLIENSPETGRPDSGSQDGTGAAKHAGGRPKKQTVGTA